jgi:hypothetical protein
VATTSKKLASIDEIMEIDAPTEKLSAEVVQRMIVPDYGLQVPSHQTSFFVKGDSRTPCSAGVSVLQLHPPHVDKDPWVT